MGINHGTDQTSAPLQNIEPNSVVELSRLTQVSVVNNSVEVAAVIKTGNRTSANNTTDIDIHIMNAVVVSVMTYNLATGNTRLVDTKCVLLDQFDDRINVEVNTKYKNMPKI